MNLLETLTGSFFVIGIINLIMNLIICMAGLNTRFHDFGFDMTNLLDSLVDDSGKVEYSSKAAILNVRKLFENAGQLYVEKLMQE